MTRAKVIRYEDNPNLFNVVNEVVIASGLPMPKVAIVNDPAPNAFATGRNPENALIAFTTGLLAVAEAYPDLKSSTNFLQLQEELATTENKVSFARQFYNDTVRSLNTAVKTIPSSLFVGLAKVGEREFYEVDDPAVRNAPNVKF